MAHNIIIIGAGIGGLAAAIRLQAQGHQVSVYEAGTKPGGKLNQFFQDGFRFDAGPSLFTLPEQVEELFSLAGKNAQEEFPYESLPIITRYQYEDGTVLHAWADPKAFAQEIQEKTDDEAAQVEKFLQKSQELYGITSHVFLERSLHQLSTYLQKDTLKSMLKLHKLDAFRSMNRANKGYFSDPRVVQLFNRYATYNGSNPYVAPATLNIIAHLEHNLGAFFPKKGMYQISESLYELAVELGVSFHFGQKVDEITVSEKSVTGIRIGEIPIAADLVVSNADVVPTYRHLLASEKAPERTLTQPRSSSALIFYWGMEALFPELDLHNIFFSQDYSGEFETMWEEAGISDDPTVYLYISSKQVPDDAPAGKENWFVMINVPPQNGQNWDALVAQARKHIIAKLSRMLGRDIESLISSESVLDPRRIEAETSSYQGALYGNSSNNRFAAFLRHPNFSPRIKGLYFCGGSVHPGGGIPLCLLSARIVSDLIEKRHT